MPVVLLLEFKSNDRNNNQEEEIEVHRFCRVSLLEDLCCDGVEIEQTNCQMFSQFPTESHWSKVVVGRGELNLIGRCFSLV